MSAGLLLQHEAEALQPLASKSMVVWAWLSHFWSAASPRRAARGKSNQNRSDCNQNRSDCSCSRPQEHTFSYLCCARLTLVVRALDSPQGARSQQRVGDDPDCPRVAARPDGDAAVHEWPRRHRPHPHLHRLAAALPVRPPPRPAHGHGPVRQLGHRRAADGPQLVRPQHDAHGGALPGVVCLCAGSCLCSHL